MKSLRNLILLSVLSFIGLFSNAIGQSPPSLVPGSRPNLPMNIPPPPSFASLSNKNGKYQIISAEYYSEDAKPFLYKRLVKLDTSTGEAWVLSSKIGSNGEQRKWIPLETKK
jgi:hypothetical protein